ncbi:MAG: NAD-dependent epimerase/dehydratase family protein [Acidiferrobacteraceae bacterium]
MVLRRRALILGAAGQVAPFLATRLVAAGYEGTTVSRRPPPSEASLNPAFVWRAFDLEGNLPWSGEWVDGACLFSSVPLWLVPRHIGILASQGLRQVVAFSSTSVYTKAHSRSAKDRQVAERLRQAEADLVNACDASGLPYTIPRPTLIYGSGRDGNVSAILGFIKRLGFFPIVRPGRGLRQPVQLMIWRLPPLPVLRPPRRMDVASISRAGRRSPTGRWSNACAPSRTADPGLSTCLRASSHSFH